MKPNRIAKQLLLVLVVTASNALGQTLSTLTDVVVIPKGSVVGLQVTCTGCDAAGVDESISAVVDDTNYATVDPASRAVAGDPFVTIFNIKGENQGGTILRLSFSEVGEPVLAQKDVTVQVVENIDDDCIFDDLTASESDREGLLSTLRHYRDAVLEQNARGRRYANLYYEHSPEMIRILSDDAELREAVLTLVRKHQGALETILAGGAIKISQQELAQVDGVLARLQTHAGPALSRTLTQLRGDLRDKSSIRSFGAGIQR